MGFWRRLLAGETEDHIAQLIRMDPSSLPDRGDFALRKFQMLLEGTDTLTIPLDGKAKEAHARLVQMGQRALPALRVKNQRLIADYQAYCEWLKGGPSANPYENYSLRSDAEKQHRHVMEMQQARIMDVIQEIESLAARVRT